MRKHYDLRLALAFVLLIANLGNLAAQAGPKDESLQETKNGVAKLKGSHKTQMSPTRSCSRIKKKGKPNCFPFLELFEYSYAGFESLKNDVS